MDDLHTVLRSISGGTKSRPEHLTVFREFLAHLEKIQHKAPRKLTAKPARAKPARRKARRVK
ncbi:MAG: hypothetical protein EKK40_15570 [Bradyrhizobiaceae bacterium]|nr:MAG: hypothetical protein EKK40_15570 [Bradyrhizobiaceae bacterium]